MKNYLSAGEAMKINNMNGDAQNTQLGSAIREALQGNVGWKDGERLYVDGQLGNDNNTGESWDNAFKTIQAALNKARYVSGTTEVDYSKNRRRYVFVFPGVYNEQLLFSGYNIHLIGLSYKVGNVDYGVVLNKDGAVTTTAVIGVTGAGIEIAGLQIHNEAAIPTLYMPTPGDGCWIHDCFFDQDDTNVTYGIQIDDCRNCIIENNRIFGFQTAGIKVGSNGTWFRNSIIQNNHIAGSTGKGIYVPSGTIAGAKDGSVIRSNTIVGTATTGIHQESAGAYILIADNWIQAGTALTDAGSGDADNHTAS